MLEFADDARRTAKAFAAREAMIGEAILFDQEQPAVQFKRR